MKETDKIKIFLSHSYLDRKIADRIIEKMLVPVFEIDKQKDIFCTSKRDTGVRSSLNWRNKIKSNLLDCQIFIALITSNFRECEMCLGEIGAAWVLNKKIYSLILPPINHEDFSILISELQADTLINREEIESFISSMSIDLKQVYNVEQKKDVDVNTQLTKFIKSVKQYIKRNPGLFSPASKIPSEQEELKDIEQLGKINEAERMNISETEIKKIFDLSKKEWPKEYSMQEYYIYEQMDALAELRILQNEIKNIPEKVSIIQRAIKEWPNDYAMQLYKVKEELDAFNRLN